MKRQTKPRDTSADIRARVDAVSNAVDGLDAIYEPGARPPRSHDAGVELARAVVEYFGSEPIDRLLTSDIALRDCARAIVAEVEGRP
jgi:hypothetical protein